MRTRSDTGGGRRLAKTVAGVAGVVALVIAVLLATSAGGESGNYTVRAIFDDAGNLISGEDVKIAGVKVGTVEAVTPTPQAKAAVVINISKEGFKDFRADASCTIRPQALIGEKYVDCLPTQPRVEGTPLPPALQRIPHGQEGEGQYLLPVQNTHSPVDVDLLGDISRLPERQRLTIILNELGAGLAGRGSDLHEVVQRANPALQELDKVLNILASENHVLAELAVNSDASLKPFAAVREKVADFIVQANKVAQASAAHRGALQRNLEDFPPFLRQVAPAMERIERFAEQTIPTFRALNAAATGINQTFTALPGFSYSSIKFFKSLGQTAKQTGPALTATEPLLTRLQALGNAGKPFAANAAELLGSLRETGGLERIMDFIFLGAGAGNGYDSLGHFLRAEGVATVCLKYATKPVTGCSRKLVSSSEPSSSSSSSSSSSATTASLAAARNVPIEAGSDVVMARTLAVLKGATPAEAIAKYPSSEGDASQTAGAAQASAHVGGSSAGSGSPARGGSSGGTSSQASLSESPSADNMLLNYLLGSEGATGGHH